MKVFIGWIVGLAAFAGTLAVSYSEDHWQRAVHRAKVDHPGWVLRQGTITQQKAPNFHSSANGVPFRPSLVTYQDFYDRTTRVGLDLPYGSKVGSTLQVDVNRAGAIYAPAAVDFSDQVYANPRDAVSDFWPVWSITIGVLADLLISVLLGTLAYGLLCRLSPEAFAGRLGTR